MSKQIFDGNIIGRVGAMLLLIAVGFGHHRLNCADGAMCPLMQTDSCCAGAAVHAKAAPAAVPANAAK